MSMNKVLIARSDRRSNDVYHTERCGKHPTKGPREVTEAEAKELGLTECGHCNGFDQSNPDRSYYNYALRAE